MTQDLGAAAGASAGNGDGGAGAGGAAQTWLDKIEDVGLREFAVNKGYNKGTLDEVAPNILRSYQHMEKIVGAEKAGKTLILPDFDSEESKPAVEEFYNRLGRPKEGKEYDLALPKEGVDADFEKWARDNFHGVGLTARQASALGKAWNEFATNRMTAQAAEQTRIADENTAALKKEWGAAFDDKSAKVDAIAKNLGVTDEALAALKTAMGGAQAMKMFASIADKMGEHAFINGEGDKGGALTPAEAKVELQKLRHDKEWMAAWMDKHHPKHQEAMDRKARLDAAIVAGV